MSQVFILDSMDGTGFLGCLDFLGFVDGSRYMLAVTKKLAKIKKFDDGCLGFFLTLH